MREPTSSMLTRRKQPLLGGLAALMLLGSCGPPLVEAPEKLPPFSELAVRCHKWMSGSFNNASQVRKQPDVAPRELHQCGIWPSRTDGLWLYSEEVDPARPLAPMRQVVYRITDDLSGGLLLQAYTLPGNTLLFAGEWQDPDTFNQVDPFNLSLQAGCGVHVDRQPDGRLSGGTQGTDCASTREGASYQTETISIGSLDIKIWRRGFDQGNKQVWGSQTGPMIFERSNAAAQPESIKPGSDHIPDIGPYTPKRK